MSTVQSFQYTVDPAETMRLQRLAEESRKLEILQLQAQQNANRLYEQLSAITAEKKKLMALDGKIAESRQTLDHLDGQLNLCRTELIKAEKNLAAQIQQTKQLHADLLAEQQSFQQSFATAQNVLTDINRITQTAMDHVEDITSAIAQGAAFTAHQTEVNQRLHEVETELRFLTRHADIQPAALITLEAMRENGYRLREVISAEGLTSYFEHMKTAHQIAVRIQQPARQGESLQTWDMLAETFNMSGETCLSELEDFELSVDAAGCGHLKRGEYRVYPKDGCSKYLEPPLVKQRHTPTHRDDPTSAKVR